MLEAYGMRRILLLVTIAITGCDNMCGSELLNSVSSPNGNKKAVSFVYDCGATTGFSTQVSILDVDDLITSAGNIMTTDGKNNLKLEWVSDKELLISNTKRLKIFKKERSFKNINVSYY